MNNSENTVKHPNIKISHDPYSILKDIRLKNVNRIIIGYLNINSVRNKFEMVSDLIRGSIDIFLISETKIDSTFPTSQFKVYGYSLPYRLDRSQNGGGLLLYVREDIPSKLLQPKSLSNIECIRIDISISKRKWLLLGLYNPPPKIKFLIFLQLLVRTLNIIHNLMITLFFSVTSMQKCLKMPWMNFADYITSKT